MPGFDLKQIKRNDQVILGAGILFLLLSFFAPFYGVSYHGAGGFGGSASVHCGDCSCRTAGTTKGNISIQHRARNINRLSVQLAHRYRVRSILALYAGNNGRAIGPVYFTGPSGSGESPLAYFT